VTRPYHRREFLQGIGFLGSALRLGNNKQLPLLRVAGREVTLQVSAVSTCTVRVTIRPLANGSMEPVRGNGSLVQESGAESIAEFQYVGPRPTLERWTDAATRPVSNGRPVTVRFDATGKTNVDGAAGKE
jgi:hypothetical protein